MRLNLSSSESIRVDSKLGKHVQRSFRRHSTEPRRCEEFSLRVAFLGTKSDLHNWCIPRHKCWKHPSFPNQWLVVGGLVIYSFLKASFWNQRRVWLAKDVDQRRMQSKRRTTWSLWHIGFGSLNLTVWRSLSKSTNRRTEGFNPPGKLAALLTCWDQGLSVISWINIWPKGFIELGSIQWTKETSVFECKVREVMAITQG